MKKTTQNLDKSMQ